MSIVWKHDSNKYQQVNKLHLVRPSEKELAPHFQRAGKLVNYAESHCLNTDKALQKVQLQKDVSAFCFSGSSVIQLFSGFDDGLICSYEFSLDKSEKTSSGFKAFIGHMNKINHLIFEAGHLFSTSQDCTVRQWTTEEPNCLKVFKF